MILIINCAEVTDMNHTNCLILIILLFFSLNSIAASKYVDVKFGRGVLVSSDWDYTKIHFFDWIEPSKVAKTRVSYSTISNVICIYRLEWGVAEGQTHALERIENANRDNEKATTSFVYPCYLKPPPILDSEHPVETTVYYWANLALQYARYYMFDYVTPDDDDNLKIRINDGTSYINFCFQNSKFCYWNGKIQVDLPELYSEVDWTTMIHEVGHYVEYQYDFASSFMTCDSNSEVFETGANMFAMLVVGEHWEMPYRYQGNHNVLPAAHFSGAHINTERYRHSAFERCNRREDVHDTGDPLEQAFWEILFSVNCNLDDCNHMFNTSKNHLTYNRLNWKSGTHANRTMAKILAATFASNQGSLFSAVTHQDVADSIKFYMALYHPFGYSETVKILAHHGY